MSTTEVEIARPISPSTPGPDSPGWLGKILNSFSTIWKFTGPGAMIGTAYLNAGSIEASVESGAAAQFQLLWVGLLTSLLSLLLQRLALRLGALSRQGLADHCTTFYCKAPRYAKWALMELSILSCDMQNVIGTAVALYILSRTYIPLYAGVVLSLVDVWLLLLLDKYGARSGALEILFAVFVVVIAASFGFEYLTVQPDQPGVLHGIVVPSCKECAETIYVQAVAVVGAGLNPHNLFLHSGLVKDLVDRRGLDPADAGAVRGAHLVLFLEMSAAVLVSYVFSVFITSVMGATVFGMSNKDLRSQCNSSGSLFLDVFPDNEDTPSIDLYSGGVYLGCRYGSLALTMWAVGLLTAALAGTLHGCRAGRVLMEGFLRLQWGHWRRAVLGRLLVCTALLPVTLFCDVGTLVAVNALLNLVLTLHLPAAAIPAIALTANRDIMGDQHVNSVFSTCSTLLLTGAVVATNGYLLARLAYDWLPAWWGFAAGALLLGLGYLAHVVYLLLDLVSSCGACPRLSSCKLGQRYLNQPCAR